MTDETVKDVSIKSRIDLQMVVYFRSDKDPRRAVSVPAKGIVKFAAVIPEEIQYVRDTYPNEIIISEL